MWQVTRGPLFGRWHFQTHISVLKLLYFDLNFDEDRCHGTKINMPVLVKGLAVSMP